MPSIQQAHGLRRLNALQDAVIAASGTTARQPRAPQCASSCSRASLGRSHPPPKGSTDGRERRSCLGPAPAATLRCNSCCAHMQFHPTLAANNRRRSSLGTAYMQGDWRAMRGRRRSGLGHRRALLVSPHAVVVAHGLHHGRHRREDGRERLEQRQADQVQEAQLRARQNGQMSRRALMQ